MAGQTGECRSLRPATADVTDKERHTALRPRDGVIEVTAHIERFIAHFVCRTQSETRNPRQLSR